MKNCTLILLVTNMLGLAMLSYGHPHNTTEQQALLTLGLEKLTLKLVIMPSHHEGLDLFQTIDTDQNGEIDSKEKQSFANSLLCDTSIEHNGRALSPKIKNIVIPNAKNIATGLASIEITSESLIEIDPNLNHQFKLSIRQAHWAKAWFIQPFYTPDLAQSPMHKSVKRLDSSKKIEVYLAPIEKTQL